MADLIASVYATNKIVKHSGFSTTITSSFTKTGAIGIVWKDPDVYFSDTGYTKIFKGTGFSATVQSSISVTTVGMDFAGSDLLSIQDSTKVYKFTGFSATVSASFTNNAGNRGVAWDGTNVLTANNSQTKIRKHTGFSSTVADSFASGTLPKDITWDGTNLISTQGDNKYRLHSGFSATISSSIAVESGNTDPYGIDWDGYPSTGGTSAIKTINGLALASVKTVNGLQIASVKTVNGLA